jgi:hypothetical protein
MLDIFRTSPSELPLRWLPSILFSALSFTCGFVSIFLVLVSCMFVPIDGRLRLGGINFPAASVGGLWFTTVFVGCVNSFQAIRVFVGIFY